MYPQITLLNYYLLGRLVFAVALQIAFHLTGDSFILDKVVLSIGFYGFVALLRLIINPKKLHPLDFVLDLFFVTVIVYISFHFFSYSYLTLLYLFPLFFASLSTQGNASFVFPVIAILLYGMVYLLNDLLFQKESLINLSLHLVAFVLIFFAGQQLNDKLVMQANYIKRLEEERIKMQGYERLFRVSADLAHELRNPLASISASIQLLKEGKDIRDFIGMLEEETNRLTNLIKDFLIFSRPSDAVKERIELSELLYQIKRQLSSSKIEIALQIKESLFVEANRTFLESAIGNIIKNATEAAQKQVVVNLQPNRISALSTSKEMSKNRGYALIQIEDDGQGIDQGVRDRVFEPFFTTKQGGTGLGLAISYRIITELGGNISIEKSRLGGALFNVLIPCIESK